MRSMIADRNARALAALRISVGLLFLIFAQYKVFGSQFTRGGGFQFWINRFLTEGAYPFMVPVFQKFMLPHATPIAFLVAYSELAIGLALVTGVLVRPASICGGNLHAYPALLCKLPRPSCRLVAIFRCVARASGTGALLQRICPGRLRSGLVVALPSPRASRHS